MTSLPTPDEIEKLTLRAIVAYAVRRARHGIFSLKGAIDDEIIEAPLRLAEKLASTSSLDLSDRVAAPLAAARIARAAGNLTTRETQTAVLNLQRLANVVMQILNAASEEPFSKWARAQRAKAAQKVADLSNDATFHLLEPELKAVIEAARGDYEVLLKEFGEHHDVVLGEPIDLSEEWWRQRHGAG